MKKSKYGCEYMATLKEVLENHKTPLRGKILGFFNNTYDKFYVMIDNIKSIIHWVPIIKKTRSFECFNDILLTTEQHLKDFIYQKEHHSIVSIDTNEKDIETLKQALALTQKLQKDDYLINETDKIERRYPKFLSIISKNKQGTCICGKFLKYKNGYVGIKTGNNPEKGYFILKKGRFQLSETPNEEEVNLILAKINKYNEEMAEARHTATLKKDKDFNKLLDIFQDNFFDWWD